MADKNAKAKKNHQQPAKKGGSTAKKSAKPVKAAKSEKAKKSLSPAPKVIAAKAVKTDKDDHAKTERLSQNPPTKPAEVVSEKSGRAEKSGATKGSGKHKNSAEKNNGPMIIHSSLPGLRVAPGLAGGAARAETKARETAATHKLSRKELQEIRAKLLAMQEDCVEKLRERLEISKEQPSASSDIIDQASDTCDEDILMEITAVKDEQLQLIQSALEKINNGSYGVCIMCGEAIPTTRLQLLPSVLRCKNCRELYEKNQRRTDTNWSLINSGLAADGETGSEEIVVEE